jgi:hypothetical protein
MEASTTTNLKRFSRHQQALFDLASMLNHRRGRTVLKTPKLPEAATVLLPTAVTKVDVETRAKDTNAAIVLRFRVVRLCIQITPSTWVSGKGSPARADNPA